jgi:hypothetical protein
MKLSIIKSLISISFLMICIALPCEAADLSQIYSTIKRPAIASEQIKSATEFYVRSLNFNSINPTDIGYNNQEEWENESKDIPKEFMDAFLVLLKKYDSINRKVTIINRDEGIKKGIIVDTVVIKIKRIRSIFSGAGVEFLCNINFSDTESGQKLFSGVANVTSYDYEKGAFPVWGGYRHFSYHLQTATFNVAFVLTKIMIDGNLQQCDDGNCP